MRYALYHSPEPGDPLLQTAEDWLGRSAFGRAVDGSLAAAPAIVSDARRYGFHATLKAPFELAPGRSEDELREALARWSRSRAPVQAVPLVLDQPSGFFALVPDGRHAGLDAFAADVVRDFEPFRAGLSEADRARRRPESLTARQRDHLERWGYPYVMEDFAFHMTLTGRLDGAASARVRPELERRFGPFLSAPRDIATLALFAERERGGLFEVVAVHRLAGPAPAAASLGTVDAA